MDNPVQQKIAVDGRKRILRKRHRNVSQSDGESENNVGVVQVLSHRAKYGVADGKNFLATHSQREKSSGFGRAFRKVNLVDKNW